MELILNKYQNFIQNIINKVSSNVYSLFSLLLYIFFGFSILFARPFVGLYLFGSRLGELTIGILVIISFFFLVLPRKIFPNELKVPVNLFRLIILLFSLTAVLTGTSFISTYTFKTSSYIWTVSLIFIGYTLLADYDYSKKLKNFVPFVPIFTYLISTGNYPNAVIDFFNKYSDKFQFIKASDLAIGLFISLLIINKHFQNKLLATSYTLVMISIFLPVMLFNSRGSFIATTLFLGVFLLQNRKFILTKKLQFLIIILFSIAAFFLSTFRVYGNFDFYKDPESITTELVVESIKGISENKDPAKVFLSFYIQDGYLMSWDPTTDWRLDIWQDVIYDLIDKNQISFGYGYKEIIPVMLDPSAPGRLGRDGLNENVHNYFVNILARGGLLQLIIFIIFYFKAIQFYKNKFGDYKILILLFPIMILSSLDVTMEGVNFPVIFYSYLGYTMKKGI